MTNESPTSRWVVAILCCVLVAIPWWGIAFPPISDLAQQVAQIRMFFETLDNPHGPYLIPWTTPNRLVYVILAVCWKIVPTAYVGTTAMMVLCLLWVISHHWLAYHLRISSASAVLACLFVFNSALYWGLLNFLCGWPLFLLWFVWTTRETQTGSMIAKEWVCFFLLGGLLFLAHALWFVTALLWLGLVALVRWQQWQRWLWRGSALIPTMLWVWYWRTSTMADSIYEHGGAAWDRLPWQKLALQPMLTFGMGHLVSPVALVLFLLFLLVVCVGAFLYRKQLRDSPYRMLLLAALFFGLMYMLLPRRYQNTIEFDRRWLPCALVFLAFAIPWGTDSRFWRRIGALLMLGVFCVTTALVWQQFDQQAMRGMRESLQAVTPRSRVMGLDFIKHHPNITGRPFLQMYAYTQVYQGAELNFSFATFPTLLVRYKQVSMPAWPVGLDWRAERIFTQRNGVWLVDMQHFHLFDFVLIHANPRYHAMFEKLPMLQRVSPALPWRLYRVKQKTAQMIRGGKKQRMKQRRWPDQAGP